MRRHLLCSSLIAIAAFNHAATAQQYLSGTITAGDTGSPLQSGTVVAVQKNIPLTQRPGIYSAAVNAAGHFTIAVPAGQYQLCVHGVAPYLDPCQWGAPVIGAASPAVSAPAQLVLQKGAEFILRVHDLNGVLPAAEAIPGSAVTVYLTGGNTPPLPLPLVYNNVRVRDYGAVVPLNLALSAVVASGSVSLADATGAALAAQGLPFQIAPGDIGGANPLQGGLAWMFPRPTAKMLHVYASARN